MMNNEGLRTIEGVTTLPGLQWVEAPMDGTNSLKLQLPESGNYYNYFEPRVDGKGFKLSEAGRLLVDANWFGFRNIGGMADSWEVIKDNPDRIGQRIKHLERSRGVLFDSLQEAAQSDPDAQRLINLMNRSFEARIRGMETTRLNAEIEAGNSPWKDIVEEVTDRFVKPSEYPNLRRGAALSLIQAKRREIEEASYKIIQSDKKNYSELDHGRLGTHIENEYAEKAKAGFSQILPGNMKGLGINGLDGIVGRASSTQAGTSKDISQFFDECAREFSIEKKNDVIARVTASHIEALKRPELSKGAKIALALGAVAIVGGLIGGALSGEAGYSLKGKVQRMLDSRNNRPAYVSGTAVGPLTLDLPPAIATQEADDYFYSLPPQRQGIEEEEVTDIENEADLYAPPPGDEVNELDVMDDAGEQSGGMPEMNESNNESFHDWVFEIDGVDFSQDYQMIVPPQWAKLLTLNDKEYIYSLDASAQLENREPTEADFSYYNDNYNSAYTMSSQTHHENFMVQVHSYPVFLSAGSASREDNMLSDFPGEIIRRAIQESIRDGKIPEELLNNPLRIIQDGKVIEIRFVGAAIVPAKQFSYFNIYPDDSLPSTLTIGEGGINLNGGDSVGNDNVDLLKPRTIFFSTCHGIPNWKGEYPQRAVGTFVVVDESDPQEIDAIVASGDADSESSLGNGMHIGTVGEAEATGEMSNGVLDLDVATFASEFGTNFQTQYLSELASSRPELVEAYKSGTNSRAFLEKLFREYTPASSALANFVEINNLQNIPWEEQLTAYLYTQITATGSSIDSYLSVGRAGSHGSSFGIFVPSPFVPGDKWIKYNGIMYRGDAEVSSTVPVDETFQFLLYEELVGENEEAWRRWGYNEQTISDSLTFSNVRAFLELIEKVYMAEKGFSDRSYEFIIGDFHTYDPTEAGVAFAKYLSNLLGREVTPDEILSLVNRHDFNALMDEAREIGINLENSIGMTRPGLVPLLIKAHSPQQVATTSN